MLWLTSHLHFSLLSKFPNTYWDDSCSLLERGENSLHLSCWIAGALWDLYSSIPQIYRRRNWGPKKGSGLYKVTQRKSRAWAQTLSGDSPAQKQEHCRQRTKQVQRPWDWPVPILQVLSQTSSSLTIQSAVSPRYLSQAVIISFMKLLPLCLSFPMKTGTRFYSVQGTQLPGSNCWISEWMRDSACFSFNCQGTKHVLCRVVVRIKEDEVHEKVTQRLAHLWFCLIHRSSACFHVGGPPWCLASPMTATGLLCMSWAWFLGRLITPAWNWSDWLRGKLNFSTRSSNKHDSAAFSGQQAQLGEESAFQPEFNKILPACFEIPKLEGTPIISVTTPPHTLILYLASLDVKPDSYSFLCDLAQPPWAQFLVCKMVCGGGVGWKGCNL